LGYQKFNQEGLTMKKLIVCALAFVLCLVAGCKAKETASETSADEGKEPIYVAFLGPRTGDSTMYGTYLLTGAQLKVDQVNAAGGVNGRLIVLDVYDDGNRPQESASIAQIIVDDEKYLAAVGPFNTPCTLAAATVFDEAEVVEMVPCAGADSVHETRAYTIRQQNTNTTEFTFLAEVAVNDLKAESVAIIYLQNDSGIMSQRVVTETVLRLGKKVALSEGIMPDQISDYTSLLTKVRNAGADIVITTANANEVATIIKQSKQLGMDDIRWLCTGSIFTDEFLQVGGDAVNGVYSLTTYFSGNPNPRVATWTAAYKAKNPDISPNYFVTGAYECMSMLVWCFEQGALDRKAVYDKLLTIRRWDGDTGVSIYDETRNVKKDMTILQVKNGEFEMADLASRSFS
jgi:branched-chain amino acid transport system substrate-binding protein